MDCFGRPYRYFALTLFGAAFLCPQAQASFDNPLDAYIAHGETVPECGFAPVLFIDNCTAALVHPKVVLYAAHCGKNHARVHFTHQKGKGRTVSTKFCKTHPKYSGYQGYDSAFCVLNEPITDIPYVPVAFGCETEKMGSKTPVVQCGFGSRVGKSTGFGTKRWGQNTVGTLTDKSEHGTVKTSPSKIVGCPGDSGGPLLTQLEDGSWRTIGMASTIDTGYESCGRPGAVNTYAYAKTAVAWVEKESGIDITPCFDIDGTWNPTKECGKFYKGSAKGHGTWSNGCKGTPVSGFSSTCGEPFGGGKNEAPTVKITAPKPKTTIKEGEALSVKVEAKDDGSIAKVELQLDGKTVETDDKEPFEFELDDLKVGEYELKAVATDDKDKSTESDSLEIEVQKKGEDDDDDDKDDKDDEKSNDDKDDDKDDKKSDDDDKDDDKKSDDDESDKKDDKDDDDDESAKSKKKGDDDDDNDDESKGDGEEENSEKGKKTEKPGGCRLGSAPSSGLAGLVLFLLGGLKLRRRRD